MEWGEGFAGRIKQSVQDCLFRPVVGSYLSLLIRVLFQVWQEPCGYFLWSIIT